MNKKRFVCIIVVMCMMLSLLGTQASATGYTAMIVQGNTPDVGDCKVVFQELKDVPNGNSYTISTRGWHYNNGNSYHNYDKWLQGQSGNSEYALACAQNLIDAGTHDVLYWSGHGGRNPIRLNVHPSTNDYGPGSSQQPVINIASTLGVDGSDWATASAWNKNSNLKVVIFSACQVLDNTYNDCRYLVRAMKASNIRVIAGYHLTSPTNPIDTSIAEDFFYNTRNGGVSGGESIRSSWQTANELNSASSRWAVLCYKDGGNQYYRIPGFPGNTYAAPSSGATVYRFWSQYTSPTGGQVMPTTEDGDGIPIEITVGSAETDAPNALSNGIVEIREMNDSPAADLDEEVQREVIADCLPEEYEAGIELVGTITCEEMDPEIGAVPGSAVVVGQNFCYNNHLNGIRLENNFYKVCTDVDGVYCTINNWKNIVGSSEETTQNTQILSADEILGVSEYSESGNTSEAELLYVPVSETTYKLCYAITSEEAPTYYVDATSGSIVEMYVV